MADAADTVTIELPNVGKSLDTWKSYTIDSQFLTPADGWSLELGDDATSDGLLRTLDVGMRCTISVNGVKQSDGYIDDIEIRQDRSGGTSVEVHGRDMLGAAVDGGVDPVTKFTPEQTLEQFLRAIFEPYGFTKFDVDASANRNVITGQKRGIKHGKARVSKKGKVSGGGPLKEQLKHQVKPYPRESAFAFATRVAQRHGLWLWLAADGETLIVGEPDFDQAASYALTRKVDGSANSVLHGAVKVSASEQPTCIVCTGRGAGGEHDRAAMRVIAINGFIRSDLSQLRKRYAGETAIVKVGTATAVSASALLGVQRPAALGATVTITRPLAVSASAALGVRKPVDLPTTLLLDKMVQQYPGAKFISVNEDHSITFDAPMARPLFLHDDESGTLKELEHFARREMALRQRKAFEATYTVEGHEAEDGGIWNVDTVVDVDDAVLGIHEPLYVYGRTFRKSRAAGTVTDLHLIRRHTMVF